jgi:hypothetical protein
LPPFSGSRSGRFLPLPDLPNRGARQRHKRSDFREMRSACVNQKSMNTAPCRGGFFMGKKRRVAQEVRQRAKKWRCRFVFRQPFYQRAVDGPSILYRALSGHGDRRKKSAEDYRGKSVRLNRSQGDMVPRIKKGALLRR